ncbi:MAG: DMT family transporter [Gemmatimonadales bacterium]
MPSPQHGFSKHDLGMVVVSLIWGANFSANKYGVSAMPPLAFAAIRFTMASILLYLVVALIKPGRPIPAAVGWRLAGLGVVGNTLYQVFFMLGLVTTSAINASLIMAALPAAVAVLALLFGVERVTPRIWIGIAVATAGVVLVIAAKGIAFSAATVVGDLLVLAAVVCWASFTVGVRWVGRGQDPIRVTAITVIGGTPGLILASLPTIGQVHLTELGAGAWVAILYSGIFAIVIAYLLWSYAVQSIGGSRTAIYNCVIPVVAAVVAWILLGERLHLSQLGGALLVITGVLISQGVGRRPTRPADPVPVPEP